MSTNTLILVAGVGVAVYWFWYKPKKEAEAAVQGAATEVAKKAAAEVAGLFMPVAAWPPQTADTIAT